VDKNGKKVRLRTVLSMGFHRLTSAVADFEEQSKSLIGTSPESLKEKSGFTVDRRNVRLVRVEGERKAIPTGKWMSGRGKGERKTESHNG